MQINMRRKKKSAVISPSTKGCKAISTVDIFKLDIDSFLKSFSVCETMSLTVMLHLNNYVQNSFLKTPMRITFLRE